jgi:hypothetical protein
LAHLAGALHSFAHVVNPNTALLHNAARKYVDYYESLCAKYHIPASNSTIDIKTGEIRIKRAKPALKKAAE